MINKTLDEKFFKYHEENMHVYDLFKKYVQEIKAAGFKQYSMHSIMHRVRWHINVETRDPEGFKMNNNYSSRYARLLVKNNPEMEEFFVFRRMTTPSVLEAPCD